MLRDTRVGCDREVLILDQLFWFTVLEQDDTK